MQLSILRCAGAPADIGAHHGATYKDAIQRFAAERTALACDALWVGRDVDRAEVMALAEACLESHDRFAPDLTAELRALAAAAGLSPAEALIVSGFTDFMDTVYSVHGREDARSPAQADDCTAVLIPGGRSASGRALFAQTWDMHETATEHVVMLEGGPRDGLGFTVFTSMGCLGMIGMNSAGITIGINNLTGADGTPGVTWNFVVRKALQQTSFEDALACITDTPLAGAHNYLLLAPDGQGANVEAMSTRQAVTQLAADPLAHTNHCLAPECRAVERARLPASQASSENRLARAHELLDHAEAIDVDALAALTRDTQAICYPPTPLTGMTTCGAVIADPGARTLWALRGLPTDENYQRFQVGH